MHPPPTGAGRVVTNGDLQPGLGRQPGELHLPGPGPGGVGPTAVGADQQPPRGRIAGGPVGPPPAAQHRHGERRGVVVGADAHPPGVRAQVVDAIRDRLVDRVGGEVVHVHPLRAARRPPLGTAVGELADLLLLLGVHRHDRLTGVQELARARRCSGTGRPGPGAGRPRRPWRCPASCSPRPSAAAPPSAPSPGRPLDRQALLAAQALVTRIC